MSCADVVVVGSGPAGWAIAHACAGEGLDTVLVAPRPDDVWWPTYGLWADQCGALPDGAATVTAGAVHAGTTRLPRAYAVLDNASVLAAYRRAPVRVVRGTVVAAERGGVVLRSGDRVAGRVVVDATGQRRVLSGGRRAGERVEQTAYGVVVPASAAAALVPPGDAVFMRWGATEGWPTFLYAVPLPGGRTLLEETSLARRPGLPFADLAARLTSRLAAAGISATGAVERVRFAVDVPVARPHPGVVAFGVAAGMTHPATGYSVGEVLAAAPAVAATLARELRRGGDRAARAAHAVLWTPRARAVRGLRDWGLRSLLAMPPARVPEFFDAFFSLPEGLQRAYLSGRDDLLGTAAAMAALFGAAPWRLRRVLVTGVARRSGGPAAPRRPAQQR